VLRGLGKRRLSGDKLAEKIAAEAILKAPAVVPLEVLAAASGRDGLGPVIEL
jgi:hypothetical protein